MGDQGSLCMVCVCDHSVGCRVGSWGWTAVWLLCGGFLREGRRRLRAPPELALWPLRAPRRQPRPPNARPRPSWPRPEGGPAPGLLLRSERSTLRRREQWFTGPGAGRAAPGGGAGPGRDPTGSPGLRLAAEYSRRGRRARVGRGEHEDSPQVEVHEFAQPQ